VKKEKKETKEKRGKTNSQPGPPPQKRPPGGVFWGKKKIKKKKKKNPYRPGGKKKKCPFPFWNGTALTFYGHDSISSHIAAIKKCSTTLPLSYKHFYSGAQGESVSELTITVQTLSCEILQNII